MARQYALSEEQRRRKRESDKQAQRALRQRQKDTMSRLEKENRIFKMNAPDEIAGLMEELTKITDERDGLLETIKTMRGLTVRQPPKDRARKLAPGRWTNIYPGTPSHPVWRATSPGTSYRKQLQSRICVSIALSSTKYCRLATLDHRHASEFKYHTYLVTVVPSL
jgi:hypothetical protein